MKFPDHGTILRPGVDEYGNPAASWDAPQEIAATAFVVYNVRTSLGHAFQVATGMFPPTTDLRQGDRFRLADGTTFSVEAPHPVRAPSRTVLISANLVPTEGADHA